ncbi:heme ABC exporter ATP-binding protein CcmA [Emcibacter sp. SYSU 3D8]|uniref:heme ABC exporter ATP-binding protein CcmA n=1 Tax=Emcibacter sp. SYSU 3D8 TaxID=3133969 RepID=UPI0031FF2620
MPNAGTIGLTVDNLACRRGEHEVFTGLSCGLRPGGVLYLRGPNGAGKSSLLRILAGFIAPADGAVGWNGEEIRLDPPAHCSRLHYVGHLDTLKPVLTAAENLLSQAAVLGQTADVDAALGRLGLANLRDLPARFLSAGQRRRLALARLVAVPRPLWLLDEPTVALDADSTGRLEALLAEHRDGGGMAVIATHTDMNLPGADTLELAGRQRVHAR